MTDDPTRDRPEPAAPVDGVGMFCATCQAPLAPDAGFCNKCGAPRLVRDTSPTQVLPVTPPLARETVIEEDVRREAPLVRAAPATNWWPFVALGLLGALLLVLVLFLVLNDDDNGAVDPDSTTTTTTTLVPGSSVPPVPLPVTQPPQTVPVPVQTSPTTVATTTTAPTTTTPATTVTTPPPATDPGPGPGTG